MTRLRWDAVTINCGDPEPLAAFWAALLGVEIRGRWEQYVGLHPVAPGLPRLVFQRVEGKRPASTWVHVDLHVPSRAELPAAVDRAVGLGARPVEVQEQDGETWQVLADPEGNLFCLVAD